MEVVLEILKYTLPAGIVFVGVYFVLKSFLESEQRKAELKYRSDNFKLITPTKLQAYERMILFLERINLSNLVMRMYSNGMSAKDLQTTLLAVIRSEYDHNMAQQLYVPSRTWKLIKSAREETVKVINSCSEQLNDNSSGLELSQFILELVGKIETTPTEVAIEALKNELNKSF
ncbi:MAG: hypothetical protein JKY48_04465 [Flavobacteriales bacterium]|nr:hypothetical protein [Flavobacteriales bacterium]